MGTYLFGWKAIQEYLKLSRTKILKLGYPIRVREGEAPRVCADAETLDEHTVRLFRRAEPYTPKRTQGEGGGKGA